MIKAGLRRSKFRNRFRLDEEDRDYIAKRGLSQISLHAFDFIRRRLAPADPKNDGKQTPFKGHPVFKAQHATATCCRGCLEKWYGIRKKRPLSTKEIEGIVETIMEWIRGKFETEEGGSTR